MSDAEQDDIHCSGGKVPPCVDMQNVPTPVQRAGIALDALANRLEMRCQEAGHGGNYLMLDEVRAFVVGVQTVAKALMAVEP